MKPGDTVYCVAMAGSNVETAIRTGKTYYTKSAHSSGFAKQTTLAAIATFINNWGSSSDSTLVQGLVLPSGKVAFTEAIGRWPWSESSNTNTLALALKNLIRS